MKTAYTILFPSLILVLAFAAGCTREVQQSVENAKSKATPQKPAVQKPVEQKLDDNEQAPDDPPKATNDEPDQTATGDTDSDSNSSPESPADSNPEDDTPVEPTIDIPATWKRLSETQEIWVDIQNKQVIVGGKICLNAGPLEMVICPQHTKEHESIISVNAESWQVHAGLLRVGATQGVPSRWVPEYTPAWGSKIDIQVMWRDEKTKEVKTIDGKQWILNIETQKPMTTELVFGGSYSEPQIEGDQPRYQADDGELICLANFSTSTIDLRVSEKDIDIFFEANTPLIPPINTQVYTVITPGAVIGKPEE